MASNLALVPWNPEANEAVAKINENSRPEGGRWALVLKAILSPSPGRTLGEAYTSLGTLLEKQANHAAYRFGLGPHIVAQKIKAYFGSGDDKVLRLELLRTSVPPKLGKRCLKLMKYTLPSESANVQRQAFRDAVDLVTLFPGLRPLFLSTKSLNAAASSEDLSILWSRPTGPPNEEWIFWQSLAATCLTETTISAMVEQNAIAALSTCREDDLSIIERLLIERTSSGASVYSSALCVRYLGGILDLPGFWLDTGRIHADVANKLCCELARILKDIGIDILALGYLDEEESPYDYEGVDLLATALLTGILDWFGKLDLEHWRTQPWHEAFYDLLQLLRRPRAVEMLPRSSACAIGSFEDIFPTAYQDAELSLPVAGGTSKAPDTNRNTSLADLHCNNGSTTSVHIQTLQPDVAQGPDSDREDHGEAWSMDTLKAQDENGTDISSASEKESDGSDKQSDDLDSGQDVGQGSSPREDSVFQEPFHSAATNFAALDLADSGAVMLTGASVPNPTLYPSLEARRKQAEDRKMTLLEKRRDLGDDHPETLAAMESLALTHYELGEYSMAKDLWVVLLEKQQSLLGENDPEMLRIMGNFALTYFIRGVRY
ncbi:hypothetical protein MVEN_00914900 [Mycena venus]|uniref:Uncharacterized protein n=1 Tax=Mycena venus TaxID=2733690 RepID=A0A8H6Y7T0_9AGAR|nr:hypothetical protein MVEN_00914900 [Mycena venus]